VYKTNIRKNVRIAEAPIKHRSIMDYDPRSNGSKDYKGVCPGVYRNLRYQ
jgi:cellulose biosynthesis protein BcsQ